jgi:hypothetical protein
VAVTVIEQFFTAHQHTVAALGVLCTFLAVLASLGIAITCQRSNRTRIIAEADIHSIVQPNARGPGEDERQHAPSRRGAGSAGAHCVVINQQIVNLFDVTIVISGHVCPI